MRRLSSLIVLSFCFCSAVVGQRTYQSQNVELEWGSKQSRDRNFSHGQFLGKDSASFYTLYSDARTDIISEYSLGLNKTREKDLKVYPQEPSKRVSFGILAKNELWAVIIEKNREEKKYVVYTQKIDKRQLTLTGELKKISESYYANWKELSGSSINYDYSPDSSKLLLSYPLSSRLKGHSQFQLVVVDLGTMNVLWDKPFENDNALSVMFMNSAFVDNEGKVYVLSKTKIPDNQFRSYDTKSDYQLWVHHELEQKELHVGLKEKYITDIRFAVNPNGDLVGAGLFSNKGNNSVKGCFFLVYDKDSDSFKQTGFKEFKVDFIKANLNDREERAVQKRLNRGRDVELYEYQLDYLVHKEDGGVIMLAEQYYLETRSYYSPTCRCYQTSYIYHYNDVIVVSVSPKGEIEWNVKVPKKQHSMTSDRSLSYYLAAANNKLYLVFNDSPRNFHAGVHRQSGYYDDYSGGRAVVAMVTVHLDREGYYEFEPLWYSAEIKGEVLPVYHSSMLDEKSLLMYIQGNRRSQRYVKLNLK